MIRPIPLTRATVQVAIFVFGMSALVPAQTAFAFTPSDKSGASSENTPLKLSSPSTGAHSSSGGASIVRTIVGLAIVIAVIWGLTWILRQFKSSRDTRSAGAGLTGIATLALGSGRSLHLVRAGSDYMIVGSSEHGVVPIHHYTEQQARDAGLLNRDNAPALLAAAGEQRGGLLQVPGQESPWRLVDQLREWTVRR